MYMCVCVQREEDAKKVKDLATFKAQFPNVLANRPFMPAKSSRPLTGNCPTPTYWGQFTSSQGD